MPQLNSDRTGVSRLFGHNHQKCSGSSTRRNKRMKERAFLFSKNAFQMQFHDEGFSLYSASLLNREVLITLNTHSQSFSALFRPPRLWTQAIKKELEGSQSSSFHRKQGCWKKLNEFKWMFPLLTEKHARSSWKKVFSSQCVFTLMPFILCIVTNTGGVITKINMVDSEVKP